MILKCCQCFLAHVMFDSFGVGLSNGIGNAQRPQKRDDNFVTPTGFLGEFAAGIG